MTKRLAFLLLAVVLISGCDNEKTRSLIDRRTDQAIRLSEDARSPAPKKIYDPLLVSDKVWAGNTSMRLTRGVPLPNKYEGSHGITLISSEKLTLNDIASMVGGQIGLPVRVSSDVSSGAMGAMPFVPMPASGTSDPMMAGQPSMATALSSMPSSASGGDDSMTVAYEGPLSGLLDMVAGHFGINWRYDGVSVYFSRYETRVFMVESLPGTQKVKDGIKEDTSSGGSSSSSAEAGGSYSASSSGSLSQSSEMSVEMKVWDELNETLTTMLGGVGSIVVSPSSGTVAVTTTPELMRVVAKFIQEENRRLSQQIAVNVEIYAVSLSEGADFSVTFNEALDRLSDFGLAYGSPSGSTGLASPVATVSAMAPNILTSSGSATGAISGGGSLSVAILNPDGIGEISGLFSALSTIGDTTRVAQFPMTTLNNRTVSRRIGKDRTYVASISNVDSTSSSTYSSSTVTPGTVREGFSLQLTPRLLDDGRIMLQYSMSLIDIVNLSSFDTGAGIIQLPETASRVFVQQAMLRSGSTLIIGGYDDEQVTEASQGVGSPFNYFLGGGSSNSKERTMLFIAITPQVLDPQKPEQG